VLGAFSLKLAVAGIREVQETFWIELVQLKFLVMNEA
jgi:hypothetical protein